MIAWIAYPVVGGMILWKRAGNTIGQLLLVTGLCMETTGVAQQLFSERLDQVPVSLEVVASIAGYLGWITLIAIVNVFPTGRATSPLTRAINRVLIALGVLMAFTAVAGSEPLSSGRANPFQLHRLDWLTGWLLNSGFFLVPTLMVLSLGALVARRRHSVGSERLQYRWFLAGGVVLVLTITVLTVLPDGGTPLLLLAIPMNALPVAIGIAVTRYRLYDIDRVVSRTVSYLLLTVALVAVYVAIVTSVTWLLPGASDLAVATATLVAAAAFRPLLRRVQRLVDRRFDREQYDASRTVEAFADGLKESRPDDRVRHDLLSVLDSTFRPVASGVWLRETS